MMFRLNFKIALRNLWKNRGITFINVGGLAVALAAFILIMLYANYETGFDKKNPNYDNIFIIGRVYPDFKTNFTPPPLSKVIKENIPEVDAIGKLKKGGFEFAISNKAHTVFSKQQVFIEYEAAKILHIIPENGLQKPNGTETLYYLSTPFMHSLFPGKKDNKPEMVSIGAKSSGQFAKVTGSINPDPQSNINFDGISVVNEIGIGENYGMNNYFTYLQVRPGTDIANLEQKINHLYRSELIKAGQEAKKANEISIFLDPLKNQRLRPKAGSDANYKILIALTVLGFLVLLIGCINFTNLSIVQATKRAKEVGVKKVMGAYRPQLTFQFIIEILGQCLVATILALTVAELVLPGFNNLFLVELSIWNKNNALIWQLPLILAFITLIAGLYPAMILSGFKPAAVLKGNFQTSQKSYWLRNALMVLQFSIAVIFITGLLIINTQLKYMRTQDIGFKPEQVVYIKNIAWFNKPETFKPIREKIMKVRGVKSVTVANAIPDGSGVGTNSYAFEGRQQNINMLDVDFDYFETLGIKLKAGRFFSPDFKLDIENSAILNEAAVAKYGIINPIGKTIRGCDINYTIVGVVKDFKAQGFEKAIEPTIYAINNPCGNLKTEIMVKIEDSEMAEALATLKSQWFDINKLDGDNFRYQFLDEMYGRLFKKQEQLQSVFFAAAMLTIFIAILGLFAFARYITASKMREIAIRKILGASDVNIFTLINTSFLMMVIAANCIAWPLAYILTKKWLETFAYSIQMPVLPFILSALITVFLTLLTVSLQAAKAIRAKPVDALKYE